MNNDGYINSIVGESILGYQDRTLLDYAKNQVEIPVSSAFS